MNQKLEQITRNLHTLQLDEILKVREFHLKRLDVVESFESIHNYFNLTGELIREYTAELMSYLTAKAKETVDGQQAGEDDAG